MYVCISPSPVSFKKNVYLLRFCETLFPLNVFFFWGAIIFPLMLAFFAQTFFPLPASHPFSREYFSRGRMAAAKPTQGGVLKHRPENVKREQEMNFCLFFFLSHAYPQITPTQEGGTERRSAESE